MFVLFRVFFVYFCVFLCCWFFLSCIFIVFQYRKFKKGRIEYASTYICIEYASSVSGVGGRRARMRRRAYA